MNDQGSGTLASEGAKPGPVAPEIRPEAGFLAEVEAALGQSISTCYQCRKCAAGCPLADDADLRPNQIVRLIQLGQRMEVLAARAIWLCLSCETCTARCPNGVDIARLMDQLRLASLAAGVPPAEPRIARFHEAFLATVRKYGRSHEVSLIRRFKLATGTYFEHMGLGLRMFRKGKIKLLARSVRDRRSFREMMDRFRSGS